MGIPSSELMGIRWQTLGAFPADEQILCDAFGRLLLGHRLEVTFYFINYLFEQMNSSSILAIHLQNKGKTERTNYGLFGVLN